MTLKLYTLILYLLSMQAFYLAGCTTGVKPGNRSGAAKATSTEEAEDHTEKNLLELIEKFAAYEDETGQEAWMKIMAYPRDDLINSILLTRKSLPQDDYRHVDIAFVLCNLDYEYKSNREIIVSALTKTSHYKDPRTAAALQSDSVERLVARLIKRGDMRLLPVLFSIVAWADGALAEGLADTFGFVIRTSKESFLLQLKGEPAKTRQRVYELLELSLSQQHKNQIKVYLSSVPRNSPVAQVSKEMLRKLSFNQD